MSDDTIIVAQITSVEVTTAARTKHIDEHWCERPGCKRWGCFGYGGKYGTLWVCGEHRGDAGDVPIPASLLLDA